MAFYDTYGESQNRRLTQQAQNNQALQAFANFLQKGQENKSQATLQGAQSQNFLAETEKTNLANMITQLKIKQFLQSQGSAQPQNAGINMGGQTMTPQQLATNPGVWNGGVVQSQGAQSYQPIQKESEDLFGNKVIPPDYQRYQRELFDRKNQSIKDRQLEVAKEIQKIRGSEDQPMTSDSAGRYAFASEAERNLPKLKALLVSNDGQWNQDLANKLTYPWKYPKDKQVQNAKRWIMGGLTARGLIQSGTVVKDNEWGRLLQQFGIDLLNDPEASLAAIDENITFMGEYKGLIRPSSKNKTQGSDYEDLLKEAGI